MSSIDEFDRESKEFDKSSVRFERQVQFQECFSDRSRAFRLQVDLASHGQTH